MRRAFPILFVLAAAVTSGTAFVIYHLDRTLREAIHYAFNEESE